MTMKKLTYNTLAVLTCSLFGLSPTSLRADDHPDRSDRDYQLVSFVEDLTFNGQTGTGTLDGNVVLTGKYTGIGTRHEEFSVVAVRTDGSPVISGKSTITTPRGKMETVFTAIIHLTSSAVYEVEGFETITSGTGAYAKAEGSGSFVATQDNTAGSSPRVVGVFEARPLALR